MRKNQPKTPIWRNVFWAFVVGGIIAVIGQWVMQWFIGQGMTPKDAAAPTAAVMVFLGALLTGLGVYDNIAKLGGMGAALPITGFANSIVAPAMEFQREGWVLGVGARMFSIAGPVIVYGVITAVILAAIIAVVGR